MTFGNQENTAQTRSDWKPVKYEDETMYEFLEIARKIFPITARETKHRIFWLLWENLGEPVKISDIRQYIWPEDKRDIVPVTTDASKKTRISAAIRFIQNVRTPNFAKQGPFCITWLANESIVLTLNLN